MTSQAATFFRRNGKYLKGVIKPKETVTDIFTEFPFETLTSLHSVPKTRREIILEKVMDFGKVLKLFVSDIKNYQIPQKVSSKTFGAARKFAAYDLTKTWVASSLALFIIFSLILVLFPTKLHPRIDDKYSIYSSRPLVLDSNTMKIYARDARAQRINEVMREYNCPMEGLGEIFVSEADKNDIPWWLVASIAFQESSCGKNMPSLEGQNSFNSWGWGVYGQNVHVFDNWVRGIETVSSYMNEMFFSQGITEPCEIMKTYTPPSQGSWCEGVNYFGDLFKNYKTPIE